MALEQIAQWHDEQGHNGLWYVMQVVSQLLDPRTSEFTAAFVGRLVSTLISKAGSELGENLDQILRAILSKMQQAETLSVMQVSGEEPRRVGRSVTKRNCWIKNKNKSVCLRVYGLCTQRFCIPCEAVRKWPALFIQCCLDYWVSQVLVGETLMHLK